MPRAWASQVWQGAAPDVPTPRFGSGLGVRVENKIVSKVLVTTIYAEAVPAR